jgi:ABC-2 type transport system permease protein
MTTLTHRVATPDALGAQTNLRATSRSTTPRPTRRHTPIPLLRIVSVELRKSFDTRSGFWLLVSIAVASAVATAAVVLFSGDGQAKASSFTLAIGFPMAVILPMVAILSVTGEWSQRSGLTTFTMVPHRGRVVLAKGIVAGAVALASMLVAFGIGALGNLVASAVNGTDAVWDQDAGSIASVVLANTLVVGMGFMLGLLIRSSTGAIVAYFVYAFVLPPLLEFLAATQDWFHDLHPWVDPNVTQHLLFHGPLAGDQWQQLAVTSTAWLLLPLAVGIWTLRRSEVH